MIESEKVFFILQQIERGIAGFNGSQKRYKASFPEQVTIEMSGVTFTVKCHNLER